MASNFIRVCGKFRYIVVSKYMFGLFVTIILFPSIEKKQIEKLSLKIAVIQVILRKLLLFIFFDFAGRTLGSANVIFEKKNDAIKAMKEFHGVPLDGKLMKIQLTQAEIMPKNGSRMDKNSPKRNFDNGKSKFKDGRVAKTKNGSTKMPVHGTKKEAHGTPKIAKPTAEDLDKELDDYLQKKEDTENGITKTEIEQKPSEKKGKKKG